MDAFPFTAEEWEEVSEASRAVVNATLYDDDPLSESLYLELVEVLSVLRGRYGPHPVLLETQADFETDVAERVKLYEAAIALAVEEALPTFTIRLSLARVLIEYVGDTRLAREHLLLCKQAVQAHGDDGERADWKKLSTLCQVYGD